MLAIDPSSERSGGSILGDKTRMEQLVHNPSVFIRPSPSAGSLGGVARKTRESIILCEAAGFDVIFIETVGVGQSETAVHSMVDLFLLIQIAGAGDELQGIKRGIMEMADMIAINKCDSGNQQRAELAKRHFLNALNLFPMPDSGWRPRVYTCSATEGNGLSDIWNGIEDFLKFTSRTATTSATATGRRNTGCTKRSTRHCVKTFTATRRSKRISRKMKSWSFRIKRVRSSPRATC